MGPLDEAFCPIEWDEADLAYRIRERGGFKVATYNYERLGAFTHLGSSTLGKDLSGKYKSQILSNGKLFHERWQDVIRQQHPRSRRTWWRLLTPRSVPKLVQRATEFGLLKVRRTLSGMRAPSILS